MDKQERIDRAVIELDGKVAQPDDSYKSPTWDHLVRLADGRLSWCGVDSDHYRDGDLICNESEFMEARKRLIDRGELTAAPDHIAEVGNKVDWSKAPDGYDYWIEDTEGDIDPGFHRLAGDRYVRQEGSYWMLDCPCILNGIVVVHKRPRPHPDHKEGEGVEWEPGVDLPPIHEQCRALLDDGLGWVDCMILAHTDVEGERVAVFQHDSGVDWGIRQGFRKLKSHRDKVIEAALEVAKNVYGPSEIDNSCRLTMVELYEEGLLKLPGDDQ